MNREQIIDFAKWGLNVNASQFDDSITPDRWNQLCQMSYKNCWSKFRTQVAKASILTYTDIAWPSGATTFTLPATPIDLTNAVIYAIMGYDSSTTTSPTCFYPLPVQFLSRNVLSAPVALTTTMRIFYIPDVEYLQTGQSPLLIPPQHHELIAWDMLRIVKMFADKEIPQQWDNRTQELELNWVKEWSTRPLAVRAGVINLDFPILRPIA